MDGLCTGGKGIRVKNLRVGGGKAGGWGNIQEALFSFQVRR